MARPSPGRRLPARIAAGSLALGASLLCPSAARAVSVSGTLQANTTWTVAEGPYVLTGDLTVAPGATLTIEPGVLVTARGTTGTGGRLPNTELAVQGRLDARGTAAQPIRLGGFVPDDHSPPNAWAGIYFDNAAGGDLEHVAVTTAQGGIRAVNTPLSVRNASLSTGGGSAAGGIHVSAEGSTFAPSATITDSELDSTSSGVQVEAGPASPAGVVTVDRNRVRGTALGLRLSSAAAGVTLHAHGNQLQANATGMSIESGSTSTFDIAGNAIVGNDVGVLSTSLTAPDSATVTATQNNVYANAQWDWRAENARSSRPTINAEGNFWGSTSESVIDGHISDGKDDPLRATVDHLPFLDMPSAIAPQAAPPETTSPGGPPAITNSTSVTLEFSSPQAGSTFECRQDGGEWTSVNCASPKSLTNLGEGQHTFEVRAVDPAGNRDATPVIHTWQVDTTPPKTSIASGPSGTTRSTSAVFAFTTTEPGTGSGFECRLDAAGWAPCSSPLSISRLAQGPHTFRVRARDRAGNTDPSEAVRSWTVDTAPPIAASPSRPRGAPVVDLAVGRRLTIGRFRSGITAKADRAGAFRSRFTIGRRDARKLRMAAASTLFATGRATLGAAGAVKIKPRLTRRAKRALRRVRRLRVAISTTFTAVSGEKVTTRDVVTVTS